MSTLSDKYTNKLIRDVQKLIDDAQRSGERVAAWDSISELLRGAGLLWDGQVPPDQVGVHPENRSSFGVGGAEAHHYRSH